MPTTMNVSAYASGLTACGLVPGPNGYDPDAVATVITQLGFSFNVTPPELRSGGGKTRWRAIVFLCSPSSGRDNRYSALRGVRSHGATEGDALAVALARFLGQVCKSEGRRHSVTDPERVQTEDGDEHATAEALEQGETDELEQGSLIDDDGEGEEKPST